MSLSNLVYTIAILTGSMGLAQTPESPEMSSAPAQVESSGTEKKSLPTNGIENGIDPDSRKHLWPTEGSVGEQFRDVAKELRCPTCTGLSVLESDAKFSVQIKELVKEQVEAGKNKSEILQFFTDRYGPWILRSPPKTGFNVLAWGVPIAMMLVGPILIWAFVWRKKRVITALGVRTLEDVVKEMHHKLDEMRTQKQQNRPPS
jgi:cytochrome c-type biogenesis protein CcmH/NrfF